MKKPLLLLSAIVASTATWAQVTLTPIGSYHTGIFGESATEIMAYNAEDERVYSTNGSTNAIDIIDLSDPTNPTLDFSIDMSSYGSGVNSVYFKNGYLVGAVEANDPQANGSAVFFEADGTFVVALTVGAMPDMVMFSPDGTKVLTANEGEPNDAYTVDPLGSVSIIDVSGGVANLQQSDVTTLDFTAFNAPAIIDPNIRIFGNDGLSSVAQDLEPEYITVLPDGQTAIVVLQENNAVAAIDLTNNTIIGLKGLGFKDYNAAGNSIDASNQDAGVNIQNWPVYGMYQPDAIDSYTYNGLPFIVSANEGDSRDYSGYSEEERVAGLTLDATAFPDAATLQQNTNLGRLNVTTSLGDDGNDGDHEALYSYGARSFSIWDGTGNLVYDSGNDFETFISNYDAANFNSNNDDNTSFDSRSDDKGPEPEALKVVSMMGKTYAFIGLERQGGVMVYDITDPNNVSFESYGTDRNFAETEGTPAAGGLGPEDIDFIPAGESPTGFPLLLVSNEVSGSISVYSVGGLPEAAPLVITEIMYNSPEIDTDSLEFVEIFNPMPNDVDLSGYFFRQGFDFRFPQGASISANGFMLVAVDTVAFQNAFGLSAYAWSSNDALSNGGEDIVLAAPSGAVADSVDYNDAAPWPTEPDGDGYSLVLCDPLVDNNDGANWSIPTTSPTGIIIEGNEVFANPGAAETCVTVDIKEEIITTIAKLYPNPNNGDFVLEFTELDGTAKASIYSATGQLIKTFQVTNAGQFAVSETLSAGIYLVKIEMGDNISSQRFVVK
ncbi:MAG: choice-of-anchor I family protein [Flavobacteriales bacterium]|nr:choice-of-anchor I family protein [Flavobacteriales bacterium]